MINQEEIKYSRLEQNVEYGPITEAQSNYRIAVKIKMEALTSFIGYAVGIPSIYYFITTPNAKDMYMTHGISVGFGSLAILFNSILSANESSKAGFVANALCTSAATWVTNRLFPLCSSDANECNDSIFTNPYFFMGASVIATSTAILIGKGIAHKLAKKGMFTSKTQNTEEMQETTYECKDIATLN